MPSITTDIVRVSQYFLDYCENVKPVTVMFHQMLSSRFPRPASSVAGLNDENLAAVDVAILFALALAE